MTIKFNEVFTFDFTDKVQFGDMPVSQLHVLFQDGRVASKFLENTIPTWFPELEFVDQHGYDHIDTLSGDKYDLKGFTKGGASYAPSTMIGAKRKIDVVEMHRHARSINYIFSDITAFPIVKIVFKKGVDVVTEFPSGKISNSKKNMLFN
jgi:hypothetical protein